MIDRVSKRAWQGPSFLDEPDDEDYRHSYRQPYTTRLGWRVAVQAAMISSEAWDESDPISRNQFIAAVQWFAQLLDAADQNLALLIAEGRCYGLTYVDVARALGITKQAAHKRFAGLVEDIARTEVNR